MMDSPWSVAMQRRREDYLAAREKHQAECSHPSKFQQTFDLVGDGHSPGYVLAITDCQLCLKVLKRTEVGVRMNNTEPLVQRGM